MKRWNPYCCFLCQLPADVMTTHDQYSAIGVTDKKTGMKRPNSAIYVPLGYTAFKKRQEISPINKQSLQRQHQSMVGRMFDES